MDSIIDEWNNQNKISESHKEDIRKIFNESTARLSSQLDEFIFELLQKKIDDLNVIEYNKVISKILMNTPITKEQEHVLNGIDKKFITNVLQKEDNVTNKFEFYKILNINRRVLKSNKCYVLEYDDYYEYGIQEAKCCDKKMYYIRFYDMLMLDYDGKITYDELIKILQKEPIYRYKIYKTYNGFHVFITSRLLNHSHTNTQELSYKLEGDLYYILFSKYNGYIVRLNPKVGRDETIVHEYICDLNDHISEHPYCIKCIEKFNILNNKWKLRQQSSESSNEK